MRYEEAVKLPEGFDILRSSWPSSHSVARLHGFELLITPETTDNAAFWAPSAEDLTSDDWTGIWLGD